MGFDKFLNKDPFKKGARLAIASVVFAVPGQATSSEIPQPTEPADNVRTYDKLIPDDSQYAPITGETEEQIQAKNNTEGGKDEIEVRFGNNKIIILNNLIKIDFNKIKITYPVPMSEGIITDASFLKQETKEDELLKESMAVDEKPDIKITTTYYFTLNFQNGTTRTLIFDYSLIKKFIKENNTLKEIKESEKISDIGIE